MLNVENRTPYPGKEGRVKLTQDNGQVIEGVLEMADDATAPGTPWTRQSGRLLQADIRSYPVADGQTITAGDVVDVVEGEIQKTLTPQANVETSIEKLAWSYTKTEKISTSKLAVMSNRTSATPPLNVWVFDVSAEGIISNIKGTDVIGDIIPYNNVNARSFSVISEEKIVVFYNQSNNKTIRAKVCTINENNTLSLGSAKATEEFSDFPSVIESIFLDNDAVIVFSNDSGLNARICTVSGTTPTWASNTYRLSGNTSASHISATRLPDSGTTRRVCVCYSDGGDSNKGKAVIVNIDGSNNVTWGTPVVFNNYGTTGISTCSYENNAIVFYRDLSGSGCSANVLQTTDNSISFVGNKTNVSFGAAYTTIVNTGLYIVATAGNTGETCVLLNVSGTNLNVISGFSYNSDGVSNYISSAAISQNQIILTYADAGNSNYGTATILTVEGNQIGGSFLDGSKDAIALQSGTGGQSIEVIYSGITNADWVTEGQTIASDGVYGVGVLDKVLQVWSKDRPGQIVVGTYIGIGGSDSTPQEINLGFSPLAVLVEAKNGCRASSASNVSFGGLALRGATVAINSSGGDALILTETGFTVYRGLKYDSASGNSPYRYIAWR